MPVWAVIEPATDPDISGFVTADSASDAIALIEANSASRAEDTNITNVYSQIGALKIGKYGKPLEKYRWNDALAVAQIVSMSSPSPYLKLSWSGSWVTTDLDDGMEEMESDGVNTATLNMEKYNEVTNPHTLMTAASDNEKFCVCVAGIASPPVGRFQLVNGIYSISFTPTSVQKGLHKISITGINNSLLAQTQIRFI